MKLSFYYVDQGHIEYLKEKEIEYRGFTTVPNLKYASKTKFVYGVVMQIGELNYFVPVTSYNRSKEDNIVIKVTEHKRMKLVGSLRFNYMIPVPGFCLTPVNFKDTSFSEEYKILLDKEYRYLKKNVGIGTIQKQAKKTYEKVLGGTDLQLIKNSCAFQLLERACLEYIDNHLPARDMNREVEKWLNKKK